MICSVERHLRTLALRPLWGHRRLGRERSKAQNRLRINEIEEKVGRVKREKEQWAKSVHGLRIHRCARSITKSCLSPFVQIGCETHSLDQRRSNAGSMRSCVGLEANSNLVSCRKKIEYIVLRWGCRVPALASQRGLETST